jgi:hypothetical protein
VGNLGLYEWLTTAAKAAGGPQELVQKIGKGAVVKAAPKLIALGAAAGGVIILGGQKLFAWRKGVIEKGRAAEEDLVVVLNEQQSIDDVEDSPEALI